MVKVLVADDSALMRKMISDLLSYEDIQVVGTAYNGEDTLNKIKNLNPEVLTLDLEMPGLSGVDLIKKIRSFSNVPILIISASDEANIVFKALEAGATDFISKPSGNISLDLNKIKDELLAKIRSLAHVKISKVERSKEKVVKSVFSSTRKKIVVIAASTGGPQTLEALFSQIPKNIPAPILVVQHMPPVFTKAFASRLDKVCELEIKEAVDGDELRNGVVFLAPGNYHMELISDIEGFEGVIRLNQGPSELGLRPNANILFRSVTKIFKENTIGIVLTGMGKDGTDGARVIKENHGLVITQSKESSILYGMPKSVFESGYFDLVLDLDKIPVALLQALDV